MPKFVLRVDDCGWVPPDKTDDRGLTYFRAWREAFGLAGAPAVLGFIPATMTPEDVDWLRAHLSPEEEVAIHGWDHAPGAVVSAGQMRAAVAAFAGLPCRAYIPPFNAYDEDVFAAWQAAEGRVVFGGFAGEHHAYGVAPERPLADWLAPAESCGVWHVNAARDLYDRAGPVLAALRAREATPTDMPLVITLHATWDVNGLSALRPLLAYVRPHLIGTRELLAICDRTRPSAAEVGGGPFVASRYVIRQVGAGRRVLALGGSEAALPQRLALRGCAVTAVSGDPPTLAAHGENSLRYDTPTVRTQGWDPLGDGAAPAGAPFEAVAACWEIDHYTDARAIVRLTRRLVDTLVPGGLLVVAAGLSADGARLEADGGRLRRVLGLAEHAAEIVGPSGCALVDRMTFRHGPGAADYRLCAADDANAVCYTLRKPG